MSEKQTDNKQPNRKQTIKQVVGTVRKSHGKGSIMTLDENGFDDVRSFPTGSIALDEALGIGGHPIGRVVEVFGPESSGKTTLTLHAIAQRQALGGLCAFIDAEHAFDLGYARTIGIDPENLLVSQPDYGEQALSITECLCKTEQVDLIVVDSVAALVPKSEVEGEMGDPQMGSQARLMSQALRKLTGLAHRTDTTIMFINQLRQKIGVVFGNPETTTGGSALRFYSSIRLDVRRIGKVMAGEKIVGNRTRVRAVKNKCAAPFGEAEFDIRWGEGIDAAVDLLEVAVTKGVLQKSGAHLMLDGKSIGQGKEKAREALLESKELRTTLQLATFEKLPPRVRGLSGAAKLDATPAAAKAEAGPPSKRAA